MGLILEDGKGRGNQAEVNSDNMLAVKAVTQTEIDFVSDEDGNAYAWASGTYNPGTGDDTILLVKNTSDSLNLHIDTIWLSTAVDTRVVIHLITADVTLAGVTVVGTNLNTTSSNVAPASAIRDETGNSQGDIIWSAEIFAASQPQAIQFDGAVILGKNISIGVDYVTDPTACDVTIMGHFNG